MLKHYLSLMMVALSAVSVAFAQETGDKTATWDYAVEQVMTETMNLSASAEPGTVNAVENNGVTMTVISNGASFRNNGNNIQVRTGAEFRIPVISTEDVVTVKGYPGYSYYTIGNSEEYKNTSANPATVYKARYSDVERGYVVVKSTNDNNYFYSLAVEQHAPKAPVTLVDEATTATFVLDLGTEKQQATYTTPDYFLSSKVVYGSNLTLEGNDNKGNQQTWFGVASKQTKADGSNCIQFLIQPRFGYSFTPTKVSFRATRYGTNGGRLDMAWVNPDGTTVSLDSNQNPNRDNASPNYSDYSYTVSGATAAEGACGLAVNLYSLDPGKHVGFQNIVIEGVLNGTEKEVPMLASFVANGVEYVAEDIFEANGDSYTATIELAGAETMISAENPVSDVKTISGEVGNITYEGDTEKTAVTIPVTLKDISLNYVATFVRKPFFTVTYVSTDGGTVMGTQLVEKDAAISNFDIDYTTAPADAGYRVRGWFETPTGGRKATVADVITGDVTLYAVATPIEVESTHNKYNFDLKDQYFYPEDHEAFNTTAGYWHDSTHGWAFRDGDQIELLVGPKASISIALCRYGYGTGIVITDEAGNTLDTLPAVSANETDGEVVAYNYEGNGGKLTLTFTATGELYIHSVKIVNTTEVNYTNNGDWYYVKPGDAQSLLDVIEAVSAINADRAANRSFIFIPDGTYDLKQTVLTNISGHNISLIGQSMDKTIIVNAPHHLNEGINTTATLMNTGDNIYMQDITLRNALDYYGALGNKQVGGRAVAWWDKGIGTICKNVTLLSYQDTYYSNNLNGKYYWETSDIHGTVDFFCGEGTMYFNNSTITVEMRNANGKGECTLTAPSTAAGSRYGYVFNDCKLVNYAEKYNFGRAWSNEPRCAYINLTIDDKNALNSSRWTAAGMNVPAKEFVEYNTRDNQGNTVTPESHVMTFTKAGSPDNKMETVLTAEQAAEFALDKVFPDWKPAELAAQLDAPRATLNSNGTIEWNAVEGASAYAIFRNGLFDGITTATTYPVDDLNAIYSIRSANSMGGLGQSEDVIVSGSGINDIDAGETVVKTVYYNTQGVEVDSSFKGVILKVETLSDGTTVTTKSINR